MVDNDDFEIEPEGEPEHEGYPSYNDDQSITTHDIFEAENDIGDVMHGHAISSHNEPIVPDLKEVIEHSGPFSNSDVSVPLFASNIDEASIWSEVFVGNIDPFSALSNTYSIEVHGTPDADIEFWDQQDDPNSCAVATTNMMFRSLGLDIGESAIADVFEDMGIYDPASGTNPYLIDDVVNLVADHAGINIQATEIDGFTETSLSQMLDKGIRLMVGVDSSELYGDANITLNEIFSIPDAGHAVQVTGVDNTPEGDFVTINDPGFEEGAGQKIPLERFMNAAEDFGFKAIMIKAV